MKKHYKHRTSVVNNNKRLKGFFLFVVVFLFPVFTSIAFSTSDEIRMKINIVSDNKLVFYMGKESGLQENSEYDVSADGQKIGAIKVAKIVEGFTTAEVKSGDYETLEGKEIVLKPVKPKEKKEKVAKKPEKEKKIKKKEMETVEVETTKELPSIETHPEAKKAPSLMLNGLARYETHSDKNNPDDFVYTMVSASRKYRKDMISSAFFIYKHNLDHSDNSSNIYGINIVKLLPKNSTVSMGFIGTREDLGDGENLEDNAFLLGVSSVMRKTPVYNYRAGLLYTSRFADIDQRTTDLSFQYNYKFNETMSGRLGFLYTYSTTLNVHTTNQYSATLSQAFPENRKLSLEYLLVDKTFSVPSTAIKLDDDAIFRLSYLLSF